MEARLGKPAMLKQRSEKTLVYEDGSYIVNKVIQGTFLSEHLTVEAEPPLYVEAFHAEEVQVIENNRLSVRRLNHKGVCFSYSTYHGLYKCSKNSCSGRILKKDRKFFMVSSCTYPHSQSKVLGKRKRQSGSK